MAAVLLFWLSCIFFALTPSSGKVEIPGYCIQCLCEAVSGGPNCVFGSLCHDGVCGPFAITMPYWQDAGRPTKGLEDRQNQEAYENCALDPTCAEATVRGYMTKFHQDCNVDGVENCLDYAAIHFHGGYGCNKPLNLPAKNALDDCLQRFSNPNTPVDPVIPPPNPVDPEATDENDIFFPRVPTTFPSIDVRVG